MYKARPRRAGGGASGGHVTVTSSTGALGVHKLRVRHAGLIGLSACVLAYPYQVPAFMPDILMTLSRHVDDPQPIQVSHGSTQPTILTGTCVCVCGNFAAFHWARKLIFTSFQ